jgi:hypothetical protein
VLSTSLTYRYGETALDAQAPKQFIQTGVFRGLYAPSTMTELLQLVRFNIAPLIGASTLAVFTGSHPGLALELPLAQLRMLTTFPLPADISPQGLSYSYQYYSDLTNRPKFVLIFREGGRDPINPMRPSFESWYIRDADFETSLGMITLYRTR